jgi:hypothetical protein
VEHNSNVDDATVIARTEEPSSNMVNKESAKYCPDISTTVPPRTTPLLGRNATTTGSCNNEYSL